MKQRGYSRHSKDHNPPTRWPRHQRPRFWRRKRFSSCNFFRIYVRCSRIKIARQYLRDSRTNRRESTRAQSGYLFHKGIRRRKTRSSLLSSSSSSIFLLSRSLSFSSNVKKYPRARFVVVPQRFLRTRSGQVGFCATFLRFSQFSVGTPASLSRSSFLCSSYAAKMEETWAAARRLGVSGQRPDKRKWPRKNELRRMKSRISLRIDPPPLFVCFEIARFVR